MGKPELITEFQRRAKDFRFRSERGIVALILKDTTSAVKGKVLEFTDFKDVKSEDFTEKNYDLIRLAFLGAPKKIIVEVIDDFEAPEGRGLTNALEDLVRKRFNYLAVPEAQTVTSIESWITTQRKLGKSFKAVLKGVASNNEKGLINVEAEDIKVGEKTYTSADYTSRLAGILAGLPATQSATYYVLEEVDSVKAVSDEDAAVDAGKVIFTDDGEKVKIVRAITSMTVVPEGELEDFKKIKILDSADMIADDVKFTWNDYYVGKVMNTYPNKIIFLSAVKGYLNELQKTGILDPNKTIEVGIDVDAHIDFIKTKGEDPSLLTEQEIKEYNTGSYLYGYADIRIADAMEDLRLKFYM